MLKPGFQPRPNPTETGQAQTFSRKLCTDSPAAPSPLRPHRKGTSLDFHTTLATHLTCSNAGPARRCRKSRTAGSAGPSRTVENWPRSHSEALSCDLQREQPHFAFASEPRTCPPFLQQSPAKLVASDSTLAGNRDSQSGWPQHFWQPSVCPQEAGFRRLCFCPGDTPAT